MQVIQHINRSRSRAWKITTPNSRIEKKWHPPAVQIYPMFTLCPGLRSSNENQKHVIHLIN